MQMRQPDLPNEKRPAAESASYPPASQIDLRAVIQSTHLILAGKIEDGRHGIPGSFLICVDDDLLIAC